jgi:hypothetical protein
LTPEHLSMARPIKASKQLLVEGRTPEIFFREWVKALHMEAAVDVRTFGSVTDLTDFLRLFSGRPEFRESVVSLGIVQDAETRTVNDTFQSVCASLTHANLERPVECGHFSEGKPRTGVFILPDCEQRGMLETLCWSALEEDPTKAGGLNCINAHFDCLRRSAVEPKNAAKAKVWTYLAGRGDFDPQVGRAAQAKVWNWESPVLAPLAKFLKAL